jgi:hypothetical protein
MMLSQAHHSSVNNVPRSGHHKLIEKKALIQRDHESNPGPESDAMPEKRMVDPYSLDMLSDIRPSNHRAFGRWKNFLIEFFFSR